MPRIISATAFHMIESHEFVMWGYWITVPVKLLLLEQWTLLCKGSRIPESFERKGQEKEGTSGGGKDFIWNPRP